ncbi:MAG: hypothetical protein AAB393_17385, partial [Bacteroidota bacterium]
MTPTAGREAFIANSQIADAGLIMANQFTGRVNDSSSLQDLRAAIQARSRGLILLEAELAAHLRLPSPQPQVLARLRYRIGTLQMYEGRFDEAEESIKESLAVSESAEMPSAVRANLMALLGI